MFVEMCVCCLDQRSLSISLWRLTYTLGNNREYLALPQNTCNPPPVLQTSYGARKVQLRLCLPHILVNSLRSLSYTYIFYFPVCIIGFFIKITCSQMGQFHCLLCSGVFELSWVLVFPYEAESCPIKFCEELYCCIFCSVCICNLVYL